MSLIVQEPNVIEVILENAQGPAGPSTLQAQAAAAQANQSRIESASFAQASEAAAMVSIQKSEEAATSAAGAAAAANTQVALHEAKTDPHSVYFNQERGDERYKIAVLDEETIITDFVKSLKFTGPGVTATQASGGVTINIPGGGTGGAGTANPIQVLDEGESKVAALEILDFVGPGVAVVGSGGRATVMIPGPSEQTAYKDQVNVFTKAQGASQESILFSESIAIDAIESNAFQIGTLTANTTLLEPSNLMAGFTYLFLFRQDATGGRVVTFPAIFRFLQGVNQIDLAPNAISLVGAYYDGINLISNITKENA